MARYSIKTECNYYNESRPYDYTIIDDESDFHDKSIFRSTEKDVINLACLLLNKIDLIEKRLNGKDKKTEEDKSETRKTSSKRSRG